MSSQISQQLALKMQHVPKGMKPDFYHNPDHYNAMTPIMITAHLATPYIPTDSTGVIHFDSLLSSAQLNAVDFPVRLENGVAVLPIPLEILWVSEDGLPLWASTDMLPVGETLRDKEYWHKRYPTDRAEFGTKLNADSRAGRYKEYRIPLQTIRTPMLRCVCIGNESNIKRLLQYITHVGKKNTQGFGRVAQWEVERIDKPISEIKPVILLERPVPLEYFQGDVEGTFKPRASWTPPYWYAPWFKACRVRT